MAQIFGKIFQNRKCCSSQSKNQAKSNTRWHVRTFSKEDINLVIFKDHAVKGRQSILDSRCIRKVTLQDLLCEKCRKLRIPSRRCVIPRASCSACPGIYAPPSSLPKYRNICTSNKNDVTLLGEMVFGTAPLANSATTLKVHSLKNPHQIMLSIVFPFMKRCQDTAQSADFDELSLDFFESSVYGMPKRGSENNLCSMASSTGSIPMDMPNQDSCWGSDNSLNLSASSSSMHTPLPSPGGSSTASIVSGSKLCMMRRLRRSWNRSLQYNSKGFKSNSLGASGKSSLDSETHSSVSEPSTSTHVRKLTRIGLAVIFNLDGFNDSRKEFETFFFSHITLIEGQLARLRAAVEKSACEPRDKVTEFIMKALERFQQNVYDLYTAQRLPNPVWLSMMASSTQRSAICDKFVQQFTLLIDRYDSKSTNFFVSSLLTGVLMHHLAWVPTVTPSGEAHSSYADKHSAKWLDMLAKSHPYNPLWAQLSDMYGAIGIPPRLARTIVSGQKIDTITKFLTMLSYFIRCSEIHETFDECYDDKFVSSQLELAADDDLCLEDIENEARDSEFVIVDTPSLSNVIDTESDSGLVDSSHFTTQSKVTEKQLVGKGAPDSESGFTESKPETVSSIVDVSNVPSSSPADKVRQWISTSQQATCSNITDDRPCDAPSTSSSTCNIPKSSTVSTLVNSSNSTQCLSPMSTNRIVELAISPIESKIENVRAVGREAIEQSSDLTGSHRDLHKTTSSSESDKTVHNYSRKDLVRLFSMEAELDEYDGYFDGKPPVINRQSSQQSTSMFDEYFDDDIEVGDSLSQRIPSIAEDGHIEPVTPTNNTPSGCRDVLFKVVKETGFHHSTTSSSLTSCPVAYTDQEMSSSKLPLSRVSSGQPLPLTEEQGRPRILSVSKQSSRCSTPQTIKSGGAATPTSDTRGHHMSACPTILSDVDDPFESYVELTMPRSKTVSRLADTSISTTSFGRQQLVGYSDHYMSDFVLHGTSDNDVITKVQRDLVESVEYSVLEDPLSEAVCIVADTERWVVNICSSMREQPKQLTASHLVRNMIETVSKMNKLKMSSEFILLHMEDRLQEMFFKSRMLAEYLQTRKKVDMDELDAMFGLEANDIRFLLSVAATHSTLNLHGIY